MSEQVARHEALLLADEPRLQAILPQGAVVCGDKPVIVVLAADYDALHAEAEAIKIASQILRNTEEHQRGQIAEMGHEIRQLKAEAEALRAENGRLQSASDHNKTCAQTANDLADQLSTELEAARGLLEQRIPCDVMLPPATTIKRGCPLSTVLTSMKMREDVPPNQRVFHPAPEVPDHLRDSAKMVEQGEQAEQDDDEYMPTGIVEAIMDSEEMDCVGAAARSLTEQGERQEAVNVVVPAKLTGATGFSKGIEDGWNAAIDAVLRLNTTPQPGPDVRGLAAFALELIDGAWEGGSFDGGDIQEAGVRHGILVVEQREESCGEHCSCAEHGFPIECYRLTPALSVHRQAQRQA